MNQFHVAVIDGNKFALVGSKEDAQAFIAKYIDKGVSAHLEQDNWLYGTSLETKWMLEQNIIKVILL